MPVRLGAFESSNTSLTPSRTDLVDEVVSANTPGYSTRFFSEDHGASSRTIRAFDAPPTNENVTSCPSRVTESSGCSSARSANTGSNGC